MDNGRLNFKATIDDNDFNRKLDGMKKGVNGLNEALNKNLSNQTSLINKNNNAFLEQRKLLNELKQSLSKATDKTEIARYEKSINDATNALRKLNEEAKKTPKTAPLVGGGSGGALPSPAIIGATATATDKATRSFGGLFKTIASSFGIMSAFYAVMGLIRGAFNTIVEFDSKLLNVSKTTGLAGQELKDLGVSLRALSQELEVVSVSKLTEYASVAGQLGVKGSADILAFSKALAQLEVTSNISGAEGGSQIARLLTLVDGGVTNVKAFGDEITRLGNNFPATEAEILKNSLAVAQNTGVYKLGRQEILAYGTATKSIGVEAELTGASIGRTLAVLENSIRTGKNASNVMSITGKSVEDLKSQFKTDPQGVLYSFVKGLNDIDKSGGSVNNALQSIGITAVRDQRVLGSLATGGFDVLTRALEDVGSASGAMQQEFETASGKIENSIEGVKVSWENFVLALNSSENSLGNLFSRIAGGISGVIDMIREATTSVRELNQESRQTKLNESYQDAKFYYGLGFGTDEKAREQAIKDEQKFLKQARDLNDKIAKEQKKLDDINNNRGILASAFMGKSDIAPIERDLKKFNDQLGDVEGNIKAINDLYDEWRGKETKTTTSKTPEELEAEAERKKREAEAKRLAKQTESQYKKQVQFIDEVAKVERELNQIVLTGREEAMAKISNKYDDLIKKARELKVTESEINRINELRAKETAITTYRADTTALVTSLEAQKTDYEAFEEYKKKVGIEKATEMYSSIIDVSKNYQQVLQDELNAYSNRENSLIPLTEVEKERVNELFKLLQNYNVSKVEADRKLLEELMVSTQSTNERLLVIQEEFSKKRALLENETNEKIKSEKLEILKRQEKEATLVVEDEIYQRGLKERQLIKELTTYSKKELTNRIKSTEEFLRIAGDNLSESQKQALQAELDLLNAINGTTDQIVRQNALLKEKERITNAIKNNTSKDPEIAKKLNNELEDVNLLIDDNQKKLFTTSDYINMAVQSANMLTDAFGSTNEELDRAIKTISNLVTSIASGNMAGAILTVVDWLIQGVKDVFGTDKEAEARKNSERRKNQEDYNKMLREQLLIETRINDAYQSRVSAIKEEQEALSENRKVIIGRMKDILNIIYNGYKEMTGWASLLNFEFATIWNVNDMNKYFENGVELSDELLNKLIELNSKAPLEGSMKELYNELIRLRDEFGSVDEAVKQLEKELKDRLTGTTAQSLGDSIREGIASGKRSFEDFADDIEGFLRNAILSGMSAEIIEPQIQKLQDLLFSMMEDGVLTEEERRKFEDEYARIAEEAGKYLDLINQAGVNIGGLDDLTQGASDGIKRITETQADRLTGILTGMQVDVIESRKSLQISNNLLSSSLDNLIAIEFNTRSTADNTYQIVQILQNNQQKALGL